MRRVFLTFTESVPFFGMAIWMWKPSGMPVVGVGGYVACLPVGRTLRPEQVAATTLPFSETYVLTYSLPLGAMSSNQTME